MPIFEYICKSCKSEFELIVFGKEKVSCKKCQSVNVSKLMSVFSKASKGGETTGSSCGSCTPNPSKCSSCG